MKPTEKRVSLHLPVNIIYGKDQEDVLELPANEEEGVVAFTFELTDEEVQQIVENRKLYCLKLTYGQDLQPFIIETDEQEFEKDVEEHRLACADLTLKYKKAAMGRK